MFSFKSTASTKPSLNFSFNTSSAASSLSFNTPAVTSSTLTTTATGVNAVSALAIPSKSLGVADTKIDVKEELVPAEIIKDLTSFKEYIKKQKEESNEISRFNSKTLHKTTDEIKVLSFSLSSIAAGVKRNISSVSKLRNDLAKELQHSENSHITQNMTPIMQMDNVLPVKYFQSMIEQFETNMSSYQIQISELEQHLHALNNPDELVAQDISTAIVKVHENFIALASNLHSVHSNVSRLKEQFLIYRRLVYGDTSDIFTSNKKSASSGDQQSKINRSENLSNAVALAMASVMQQPITQTQPSTFNLPSSGSTGLFGKPSTNQLSSGGMFSSTQSSLFGAKTTKAPTLGFGTTPAVTSSGITSSSTAGTLFGSLKSNSTTATTTSSNLLRSTLSAGFSSTPATTTSSVFNSSAGLTFGGSAGNKNSFDLKLPTNAKRNKT